MGTYYVEKDDTIVDGRTFCGGRKCTSADTIIIRGGARGNLLLKNFDGNGSYIPIINENGAYKVVITYDGTSGWGILSLDNCAWIDVRGNNNSSHDYGIKVINDGSPKSVPGSVWVYNEGNHIKLGYIEIAFDGNTNQVTGDGFNIKDPELDETSIFDTIEIHHNYIHGSRYAGMYLGQNLPPTENNPYIANISVHDNLLEDLGAYGITVKGVHSSSGVCSIYNNTVRRTGLIYESESGQQGIGVQYFYGTTYANIYNNWTEKTKGPGLKIGDQNHQVYDNIVCGCGTRNTPDYGHGIVTFNGASNVHLYDNIIIQPKRYGIYALGTTISARMSRNLIGDAGLGEWAEKQPDPPNELTESTGADANIYHANVADFGFKAWSDDGNYGNDDFSFLIQLAEGKIVNLDHPVTVEHGTICDIKAATENIGTALGIFEMQLFIDDVLKSKSLEFVLAGGAISSDKIDPFTAPLTGESMDIEVSCIQKHE